MHVMTLQPLFWGTFIFTLFCKRCPVLFTRVKHACLLQASFTCTVNRISFRCIFTVLELFLCLRLFLVVLLPSCRYAAAVAMPDDVKIRTSLFKQAFAPSE